MDLGMYLGMPTTTSRVTRETFAHICEKIDRKLAGWKTKYLSLAGRITLAKSTLTTMANYSMQSAKLPRTVCDDVDKRVRRFLWGGTEEKRAIHLISWEAFRKPQKQGGLAIPSARQANAAFMTKLGWRILVEPNALWARVLRAKYCSGRCDIDMFLPKPGMSNVWRGVTENAKFLCEGSQVAVNIGKTTLFWDHKWATNSTLSFLATQPIPTDLLGATVNEMWDSVQGWRWEKFVDYLPQDVIKIIQSFELSDSEEHGDLIYWQQDKQGKFTIRSSLCLMQNVSDAIDDNYWELIWSAPVQQRVRAFLWTVGHDRIMCNSLRFKRKLTDDPKCYVCGAEEESSLHILRDCATARMVWSKLGGPADSTGFYDQPLKQWITTNLQHDDEDGHMIWVTLFCVALWWIWKWRNCIVFGRSQEVPQDIGGFIHVRYNETRRAIDRRLALFLKPRSSSGREEVGVVWKHPPMDWYVLNTDGAAKGTPGPAGGAAIIRDHCGGLISALSLNFGHCHSFKAEVMALLKGLELAHDLKISKLIIQLDNLACVQMIQHKAAGRNECTHMLNQCLHLIYQESWDVKIIHVYREGNRAADWLANYGVSQLLPIIRHSSAPPGLRPILAADLQGVSIPRLLPP